MCSHSLAHATEPDGKRKSPTGAYNSCFPNSTLQVHLLESGTGAMLEVHRLPGAVCTGHDVDAAASGCDVGVVWDEVRYAELLKGMGEGRHCAWGQAGNWLENGLFQARKGCHFF